MVTEEGLLRYLVSPCVVDLRRLQINCGKLCTVSTHERPRPPLPARFAAPPRCTASWWCEHRRDTLAHATCGLLTTSVLLPRPRAGRSAPRHGGHRICPPAEHRRGAVPEPYRSHRVCDRAAAAGEVDAIPQLATTSAPTPRTLPGGRPAGDGLQVCGGERPRGRKAATLAAVCCFPRRSRQVWWGVGVGVGVGWGRT